jgi:hypothetical protein
VYPPAIVQPALQEPRVETRLFDHFRRARPTLEMHINERPLCGIAWHVRVQVTHVCEVCMDGLIRRRLPVAVVVAGDGLFQVELPRAGLYSPGFKVIVGDQGQPLDEAIMEAVEVF